MCWISFLIKNKRAQIWARWVGELMQINKIFNISFEFHGYGNYPWVYIKRICKELIPDTKGSSLMTYAITEAVCNKCKYSTIENNKVSITIKKDKAAICVIVSGLTKKCDYKKLVNSYHELKIINKTWAEYVDNAFSGRGLWVMLEAFNKVFFDKDTGAMHMYLYLPFEYSGDRIPDLVKKIYILQDAKKQ